MRIRIGISACLLGEQVRYDGGHKRDRLLIDALSERFELVPVCPEVEMGMGTPREPVRLVRDGGALRMIAAVTNVDHTDAMTRWAARRVEELGSENLSGFVLKKDSPSCGIEGVKTHGDGPPLRDGRGLFASTLMTRFPLLPVEDEDRLADTRLLEDFIERVYAYHRVD